MKNGLLIFYDLHMQNVKLHRNQAYLYSAFCLIMTTYEPLQIGM